VNKTISRDKLSELAAYVRHLRTCQ